MDEKKEDKKQPLAGDISNDSINPAESFESNYYQPAFAEEPISKEEQAGQKGLSPEEKKKLLEKLNEAREKKMTENQRCSVKEGCATAVMSGFGENNINAFAVKIGATDMQIGFVNSVPLLVASFFQLFSVTAIDRFKSRKKVILPVDLMQALTWLFMAGVALYLRNPTLLIILFTLEIAFKTFMLPGWNSLLGEIVDEKTRGKFFGFRNKVTGATSFISILVAGRVLYMFAQNKNPQYLFYGFAIIFFLSFVAKLLSWLNMRKFYERPFVVDNKSRFSFWQFAKKMPTNNFGRFIIFICVYDFAVYLASPFFTAYMLSELGMNMWTYTLVNGASAIFSFLVMTYWGKYTDIFGNKRIFQITAYMIPIVPLLFIFWSNPYYLFAVNAFSGFVWAGYNLSCSNYIYDAVTPKKRVRCMAYYNLIDGITMFLGATVGAIIVSSLAGGVHFAAISLSKYKMIFLISAVLRFAVAAFLIRKIREVHLGTPDIPDEKLFVKLMAVEPLKEASYVVTRGVKEGVQTAEKIGKDFAELADLRKVIEKRRKEKKKKSDAEKLIAVKKPEEITKKK